MSAPVSPTLPAHRSALPPLRPPAYSASPSSGSRSLNSHIATEGSSRHPHYQVEMASSSSQRLGPQEAGTMSRPPIPRRISSSSDPSHRSSSSSSANRSADPSTAPTSPSGFNTSMHRTWRPTSNVPLAVANRHRSAATADREERNRWLSEDEGLGASSSGTTRRRRRRRRSSREDEDNDDRDNDDDHHDHGAMSMTIDMAVAALVSSHPQVPVQVRVPVKRGWLKRKRVCYRHRLRNHFDQNPEESNRLNRPARHHWCEVSRSVLPMSLLSRHQVLEPIPLEYRISCPVQRHHHD